MLGCLIPLIVMVIIAVIVLYVVETCVNALLPVPPPIWRLVRLLVGVIVLIEALGCFGVLDGGFSFRGRR